MPLIFSLANRTLDSMLTLLCHQFEGLPANILGSPSLSAPPVPYQYLKYENVVVAANSPLAAVTVQTQAGKQYAATNPGSFPIITSTYSGSPALSFDMKSLLTGCYLSDANGDAKPPLTCTLQFTGTKTNGATVTQLFTYNTGSALGVSTRTLTLQQVNFGAGFTGLKTLSIKPIATGAGSLLLTGVDVDEVNYVVHTSK